MTEQKTLPELQNDIRIVGTLKSVDLKIDKNKKDPNVKQIMGTITVMVEDKLNNRVNEHEINLFAKDSSKLYKGYVTIKNEYKPADVVGKENADRVVVTGSIDENMYINQHDGKLKEFNRLRGLFINRITEADMQRDPSLANDSAIAQTELVVENIKPITNKEGIETGEYTIDAFTVGYNNSVIKLRDIVVGTDLVDVITEHYSVGDTGKLTFAINNYVEIEQQEEDPFKQQQGGFGVQVDISQGPIKKYTRELRVIGGFPPYYDERQLSEEDIKFAKQIRELKIQELKNSTPATPPNTMTKTGAGGFGMNAAVASENPFASDTNSVEINEDDLPF